MPYKSFEDLEIWKRSCQLAVYVYETLKASKDYSLRDQMQRAAVSVPSNIAEGSERTKKDFARFLKMSLGSNAELRTQAYIAARVNLINKQQQDHIVQETKELGRMMHAFVKRLGDDS